MRTVQLIADQFEVNHVDVTQIRTTSYLPARENGTDRVFRNVGI